LEPPFLIEYATKSVAEVAQEEADAEIDAAAEPVESGAATPKVAPKKAVRANREPVEKRTARELFEFVVEQGKKEYQVQRYKGLGEMTSQQLWETTMDPSVRTLLQVKLEDIAETEHIFTTLMGEDVEARRKFIEDNALDVKNLDI
jgi:DNA gyrase subunit B